ncbi:tetratricopeptide repeat protein [Bdellovibrio sp. HCB185ZH]|uniref:tetratricopeptide repeat protein n=1 Tax=Bdellovibrio sp. HCB185ZH TaxID=3394235 RepID=UPI0039A68F00
MRVSEKDLNFVTYKIPSIMLGIFAFVLIVFSQFYSSSLNSHKNAFIAPPPMLERFTFGYGEIMADSLWVRLVQDLDYCEQAIAKNTCRNNSWVYHMVDTTTNLSPKFRIAYAVGGLALTILITDIEGATKIFDKSVAAFPKDWPILYRAAYHYLYEVKDSKKAADLLIQAANNGAPPWTRTLAGRLYSDSGNIELAEKLLEEMKASGQDKELIERLEQKIRDMKSDK